MTVLIQMKLVAIAERFEPVSLRLLPPLQPPRRLGGAEGVPGGREEGGQGRRPGFGRRWISRERRGRRGGQTSARGATSASPPACHPRQRPCRRRGRHADPRRRVALQVRGQPRFETAVATQKKLGGRQCFLPSYHLFWDHVLRGNVNLQ